MARYRHPQHGYHNVGYGDDLVALEKAGWVPDVEPAPAAPPPAAEVPPPQVRREPWRSRRGR